MPDHRLAAHNWRSRFRESMETIEQLKQEIAVWHGTAEDIGSQLETAQQRISQLEAALREALAFDPYADDWDIHIEAWLLAMTRALAGSAAPKPSAEGGAT
jgi:hypothetical protein